MRSVSLLLDQVHSLLGSRHKGLFAAARLAGYLWYVAGLALVPGRKTNSRMQQALPGCPKSRFGIGRIINDRKLRARKFLQLLGANALARALAKKPDRKVFLILDTTHVRRFGRHIESAFKFKDNSTRGFITGHRVVVSMALVGRKTIPLGCRLFVREEDAEELGVPYKSQVDLAEELIQSFPHAPGMNVEVLGDSFFFCAQIVRACRALGYTLTSRSQSNRRVTGPGPGRPGWLGDKVQKAFRERRARRIQVKIRGRERSFLVVQRQHRFRKIGLINTIYSREVGVRSKTIAIVTTDLTAKPAEVLQRHGCRWAIELLFRSLKLDLGMGSFQGRHWEGVDQHLQLVLVAHLLLSETGSDAPAVSGKSDKGETLSGFENLRAGRAQLRRALVQDLFGRCRTRKGAETAIISRIEMAMAP